MEAAPADCPSGETRPILVSLLLRDVPRRKFRLWVFQVDEPPFGAPDVGQRGAASWEGSDREVVPASPFGAGSAAPQSPSECGTSRTPLPAGFCLNLAKGLRIH